jgi:hypothetical protein
MRAFLAENWRWAFYPATFIFGVYVLLGLTVVLLDAFEVGR